VHTGIGPAYPDKHQALYAFRQAGSSARIKRSKFVVSSNRVNIMKIQRIAVAITVVNLVLMVLLLTQFRTANAKDRHESILPVLRGRALEIVDSLGKIRASITLQPPVTMDGKYYPQTVLLRLINEQGGPVVKIGAANNGSGISIVNPRNDGVVIVAEDSGGVIKFFENGKERSRQP